MAAPDLPTDIPAISHLLPSDHSEFESSERPSSSDLHETVVRKRFRGSAFDYEISVEDGVEAKIEADESNGDMIKIGVDVVHLEPDTPAFFLVSTIVVNLVDHEEAIQGMHEHLVEMPTQRLEEIEEELRVQRERAKVVKAKKDTLCAMVRSLRAIKTRLRGTVRMRERPMLGMSAILVWFMRSLDNVGCPTIRSKRISGDSRIS
uniref:Uncharacterized protein n=1 Tax=Tanacetum cinerariifolium TaxID=118510 RepID=A0A699H068_TANCI|nr:hypothetical protein [Tanacetum cinerariifolium]